MHSIFIKIVQTIKLAWPIPSLFHLSGWINLLLTIDSPQIDRKFQKRLLQANITRWRYLIWEKKHIINIIFNSGFVSLLLKLVGKTLLTCIHYKLNASSIMIGTDSWIQNVTKFKFCNILLIRINEYTPLYYWKRYLQQ